jgi:hypothetical protein
MPCNFNSVTAELNLLQRQYNYIFPHVYFTVELGLFIVSIAHILEFKIKMLKLELFSCK